MCVQTFLEQLNTILEKTQVSKCIKLLVLSAPLKPLQALKNKGYTLNEYGNCVILGAGKNNLTQSPHSQDILNFFCTYSISLPINRTS